MHLIIKSEQILDFFLNHFYWLITIVYILSVFFQKLSIVYITCIFLIIIGFFSLLKRNFKIRLNISLFYLFFILVSGVLYIVYNLPLELYFKGIAYSALPIIMYFAPKNNPALLLENTFNAVLFSIIAGAVFYFWAPPFYGEFLVKHNFLLNPLYIKSSFQGLYGITAMGTYSSCCFLFFLGKWLQNYSKYDILKAFLALIALLATMRRSAVVSCLILFVIENLIFLKLFKKNRNIQVFFIFVFLLSVVALSVNLDSSLIPVIERIVNISVAISERSGNWYSNLIEIENSFLFGIGLGGGGHAAGESGFLGVYDNSYLLILRENGIIGLFIFVGLVLFSFFKFIKRKVRGFYNFVSLFVVLLFMAQAVGSNVWEFPVSGALFWLCLSTMNCNYNTNSSVN